MKKRKRKKKKLQNIQNMMGFERIRVDMWVLDLSKKIERILNVGVHTKKNYMLLKKNLLYFVCM